MGSPWSSGRPYSPGSATSSQFCSRRSCRAAFQVGRARAHAHAVCPRSGIAGLDDGIDASRTALRGVQERCGRIPGVALRSDGPGRQALQVRAWRRGGIALPLPQGAWRGGERAPAAMKGRTRRAARRRRGRLHHTACGLPGTRCTPEFQVATRWSCPARSGVAWGPASTGAALANTGPALPEASRARASAVASTKVTCRTQVATRRRAGRSRVGGGRRALPGRSGNRHACSAFASSFFPASLQVSSTRSAPRSAAMRRQPSPVTHL